MARQAPIQVEGYQEFQRNVSRAADRELPKRIGQAHKRVGEFVITKIEPKPDPQTVGTGAGAAIRPSATRREVILRVGGGHRAENPRILQWGKTQVGPFRSGRPHIIGAAHKHEQKIREMLLDEVLRAMNPAFASVSKE